MTSSESNHVQSGFSLNPSDHDCSFFPGEVVRGKTVLLCRPLLAPALRLTAVLLAYFLFCINVFYVLFICKCYLGLIFSVVSDDFLCILYSLGHNLHRV